MKFKKLDAEKELLIARLKSFSVEDTGSGCWNWVGSAEVRNGYGYFFWKGETYPAHRVSWMAHHGDVPDGAYVRRKCKNSYCVNPDHLFLGKRYGKATEELCVFLRLQGNIYSDITEWTGTSSSMVYQWMKRRGLIEPRPPEVFMLQPGYGTPKRTSRYLKGRSRALQELVIFLRSQGNRYSDITEWTGVKRVTARSWVSGLRSLAPWDRQVE